MIKDPKFKIGNTVRISKYKRLEQTQILKMQQALIHQMLLEILIKLI